MTTTIQTTTSTLVAYVMQTGGSPSLLFRTSRGNLLFDCGSNVSLMDKLYAGGITGLKAAFISALDDTHAGACSRLFMSVPVSMVFDSMEGTNASWYKDYVFSLTSKRYNMSKSSYSEGGLRIDVLLRNRSATFYRFTFGNFSLAYLGGCGRDCIGGYLNKSYGVYIVDDDVISDDLMVKYMPSGLIIPGYGNETVGIARKYGIQCHSMRKDGDMMFTSDGSSTKSG